MNIIRRKPIILHAPVTKGGIADSTHQLIHWIPPRAGEFAAAKMTGG